MLSNMPDTFFSVHVTFDIYFFGWNSRNKKSLAKANLKLYKGPLFNTLFTNKVSILSEPSLRQNTFHLAPIRMFTNVYLKDYVQGHVYDAY